MAGTFDPYHTWLGIPPQEQPPNHYRLLGLRLFEDQPAAIEHAADQRMAHLHALQTGKHGKFADRLLGEVAKARVCLLSRQKKAAYDRQLRKTLQAEAADAPKPPPVRGELAGRRTVTYQPESAKGGPAGQATAGSTVLGRLGEYELLEKLGEGGMGTVYKARHTKLKRVVALKVLSKGRGEGDRAIARFEREMEAVGRLDHPNIVRAMDAREVEGTRLLVMEYVEGLDLARLVQRLGPLPVADACELIRQAALGLQSADQHGLVHRDVKPSNLMVTGRGEVKLLDLGLARFQSEQPGGEEMTRTGQAMGTLDYMAPEQVSDTHSADIRADIYSLGCTLYKLLTGRAPFSRPEYESAFNKMQAHLREPVPPIRRVRGDVPPALVAVINRMLAKEPGLRFGTPAEVADAIGALAGGSDLPGLLARIGDKPPVVRPSRSLEATAGSSSSGLTRFLERMKIKPPPPPPGTEEHRRAKPAIIIGSAAVGVLLLSIVIALAVKSGTGRRGDGTEQTSESPQSKQTKDPRQGAGTQPPPAAGEGQLVIDIRLPRDQTVDVLLVIDGEEQHNISDLLETESGNRQMTLPAGPHKLWIARRGFEPFEKEFTIVDGEDRQIEVKFIASGPSPPPPEPSEKLPVAAEQVRQKLAQQIDQTHGVAGAKSAAEKLELAGKLLRLGRQPGENSDERFVLLRKVMELAIEGGDAAVMLEALEVLGAGFDVDLAAERQRAVTEFVGSAPPPRVYSLIEADRFAQSSLRSPKIASLIEAADPVTVGDVYWELAQAEEGATRTALMLCAGYWYEEAESDATGALPERLALRLKELAQIKAAVQQAQQDAEKEKRYSEALRPVEGMVSAWDFRDAAAALAKLKFKEPDLAGRLAQRGDEVNRLVALKAKIVGNIEGRERPYRRSDLGIPGDPGDLSKADETGITVQLDTKRGKKESELVPWKEVNQKGVRRLLRDSVNAKSADDQLAAGLLALACRDSVLSEQYFENARSLDAQIDRYLGGLAKVTVEQATELISKGHALMEKGRFGEAEKQFAEADRLLANAEAKYSQTPWLTSNRSILQTAGQEAKGGMVEGKAERLFEEAAKLFDAKDFFDMPPLIEKLKTDYAKTRPVSDKRRKPSFAEMAQAITDLGKRFTVRLDGKGNFRRIQDAVDAAPPNSLIDVEDNGPYAEPILLNKVGIIIRGKAPAWPCVTSEGIPREVNELVSVASREVVLQRLILKHSRPGDNPQIIRVPRGGSCRLRNVIGYLMDKDSYSGIVVEGGADPVELNECVFVSRGTLSGATIRNTFWFVRGNHLGYLGKCVLENSLFSGDIFGLSNCTIRRCILWGRAGFQTNPSDLEDSIVKDFRCEIVGCRLKSCDVVRVLGSEQLRAGYFSRDPQFVNPDSLNFSLRDGSPCRGTASDRGDIGVRLTPGMIEMRNKALELRLEGQIQF